ncbi:hypothetical protein [Paraglaciecola sp.]|uniref:hypothetical protein n=1 Tax=Paraglaciecola sp. TaxID=1920173 RepID=UPI0030F3E658
MPATFHIHCSSNVLMLDFDAGWDQQTQMQRLGQATLQRSEVFVNRPWAIIDDIRRWPIKSPKEMKMCTELSLELMAKGMTHWAVCMNDMAVSKWMMEKIVPKEVELAFFKQLCECKTWLSEQGFDVDFDQPLSHKESSKV